MDAASLKIERLRDKENWHQWKFVIHTLSEDVDNVHFFFCEEEKWRNIL